MLNRPRHAKMREWFDAYRTAQEVLKEESSISWARWWVKVAYRIVAVESGKRAKALPSESIKEAMEAERAGA